MYVYMYVVCVCVLYTGNFNIGIEKKKEIYTWKTINISRHPQQDFKIFVPYLLTD